MSGDILGGIQPSGGTVGIEAKDNGPHAVLRYLGGGLGRPGFPGSAATLPWRVALGRYWGADYFERIVPSPDESHVFLLTKYGTFRDFTSLSEGAYTAVAPSDEYRRLQWIVGTGWVLHGLDGSAESFDTTGRWAGTVDRNGNATTPTYDGDQLSSVSFPDGRSERFEYYTDPNVAYTDLMNAPPTTFVFCNDSTDAAACLPASPPPVPTSSLVGRLRSITEVGIAGTSRTWGYDWYGDDLVRVSRPDGTSWRFQYRDGRYPGFLTEAILRGTDGSERIVAAYAYDAKARAVQTWKGDTVLDGSGRPAPGPAAVEIWSLNFTSVDANDLPITTEVTDPLGKVTTYAFGRDSTSRKARLEHLDGSCPACGLAPNTDLSYGDSDNPLRPTTVIDGNGNRTDRIYDSFGMTTATIEAVGVAGKQRETDWTYDSTFHSFPTSETQASTSGAGTHETMWSYDPANGNLETVTVSGNESGSPFPYQTSYSGYNAGGKVGTIDPLQPASYGTADQTIFTYDPTRGVRGLILQSRSDPLVGAPWTYDYDAFNRRTLVRDPNGHETVTQYDDLNRVLLVRERADAGTDDAGNDLMTSYTYTPFGDLDTVTLPLTNRIHYGYDSNGRLTTIERQPAGGGQGDLTVRDPLNAAGQPLTETVKHWDGTQYVKDTETSFIYASRCQVQKTIKAPGAPGSIEATTEYDYDCNGNLTKVWDAEHSRSSNPADPSQTYHFDQLNRLDTVTEYWAPGPPDPVGTAVTQYGYDVQDHLASVTDANGNVTTYTTSDRDLVTGEVSPVSGATTHTYNPHGLLETTTDARGVAVTRTTDAADRVTLVDYPNDGLDVSYSYGTGANPALFDRARLTRITRSGHAIGYRYDRFGRTIGDGLLGYDYDKNGNRTVITYPSGVVATYTTDFADREESLTVTGAGSPQTVASLGKYTGAGQLRSVLLGNGLTETRSYDLRQFPLTIQVPGRLEWSYMTDHVGNVTFVDETAPGNDDRAYAYQPVQFFLRSATGPWQGPLAWRYDKIGDRTQEVRGASTAVYTYEGTTAKLDAIHDGTAGGPILHDYQIGAGGYLGSVSGGGNTVTFTWNDEGRLARAAQTPAGNTASFLYDGRGYLATTSSKLLADSFETGDTACWPSQAAGTPPTALCPADPTVSPTYSTAGRLFSRPATAPAEDLLFYFAGRPIAQVRVGSGTPLWTYLTTDHLGAPALATNRPRP